MLKYTGTLDLHLHCLEKQQKQEQNASSGLVVITDTSLSEMLVY
jgi:hypothetical protein